MFNYCSNLKKIVIPESITSIGEYAISYCRSLTEVTLPDGLISIEKNAFDGCNNLKEIEIPKSVTSIGDCAFFECNSLKKINLPNGLTCISGGMFRSCSSLAEITIPESVTSIGLDAFSGCSSLKKITIPENVTSIGGYAFSVCNSLTEIEIPGKVTSFSEGLFCNCQRLKKIVIPESVTSIGEDAFRLCSSLTEIQLPDSVTSIERWAFGNCESLKYIVIPSGIRKIADDFLYGTDNAVIQYKGSKKKWDKFNLTGLKNTVYYNYDPNHSPKHIVSAQKKPTCTKTGTKTYICTLCGDQYIENIPALGHAYGSWKTTRKATVFAQGEQTCICSRCNKEKTRKTGSKLKPTMKVNASSLTLKTGQKVTSFYVTGLANRDYVKKWKSSNTGIVKVSGKANGTCTITAGKKAGNAAISITLASGMKKNITIKVQTGTVKTTKLKVTPASIILVRGKEASLKPVVTPVTSQQKVTYKSANTKIAKVSSSGKIKAIAPGKTTIIVASGNYSIKCNITVK